MQLNTHANLISIFSWVMAGFQFFISLFYGLYVVMMGAVTIAAALDPVYPDPSGPIVIGVIVAVFGVLTLFGLAASVSNFLIGKKLRREPRASRRQVITASIINCLSFFCGGIFAAGLGAYGLWFALSEGGKAYFDEEPPPVAFLPNRINTGLPYSTYSPNQPTRDWR